jgi:hypothetical protein
MPQTATRSNQHIEEHELPSVEAVLAGTLALMTGYSQALQAELDPQNRVAMGEKVSDNLGLLIDHPQLSLGFRQVLFGLQQRWLAMSECTRSAARGCGSANASGPAQVWPVAAPKRLQ